ncbi:MAG: hypothetical protein HKP48_00720 [Winogradskyella sp.]|uniref:hypothetical protein n=1 Tax=Winogradskyella sp. TaxID=1883156 RepID=UPI00179DB780|nr:hypothetical protein [Winogradskyella sp.]MBT8244881.1 hypothetical protein [Winogradskyella sp.]NNK21839.1 hypothetical protein [Winogradskyella sp.]
MKKVILLLTLSFTFCYCQNTSNLKQGIYLTVEDLKNNKPTFFGDLKIKKDSIEYGAQRKGVIDTYALDISEEQAEEFGRIFGFNDGENVYLTPYKSKYPNAGNFHKVEIIGKFLYFEGIKEVNMPKQNLFWLTKCQNIFDLSRGKLFYNVTNGVFKKIISDKPELLKKFRKEKKKYLKYKEYLLKYTANKV